MTSRFRRVAQVVLIGQLTAWVGCATAPRVPRVTELEPVVSEPPAPYRITDADELRITVYKKHDLTVLFDLNPAPVLTDGKILVPLLGEVSAAGLTPDQLRDVIATRLNTTLAGETPYRITPSDQLRITVLKQSDLSTLVDLNPVPVLPDGTVLLPLVGEVAAAGRTPDELRREIARGLENLLVKPVVSVIVSPAASHIQPVVNITLKPSRPKIYVLGEVKAPGVYRIDSDTTAVEALALAGGLTPDADKSMVVVLRTMPPRMTEQSPFAISFDDLVRKADVRQNVVLRGGDILFIPQDYIARTNRVFQHIATLVAPFAQVFGVISQVFILSSVK